MTRTDRSISKLAGSFNSSWTVYIASDGSKFQLRHERLSRGLLRGRIGGGTPSARSGRSVVVFIRRAGLVSTGKTVRWPRRAVMATKWHGNGIDDDGSAVVRPQIRQRPQPVIQAIIGGHLSPQLASCTQRQRHAHQFRALLSRSSDHPSRAEWRNAKQQQLAENERTNGNTTTTWSPILRQQFKAGFLRLYIYVIRQPRIYILYI